MSANKCDVLANNHCNSCFYNYCGRKDFSYVLILCFHYLSLPFHCLYIQCPQDCVNLHLLHVGYLLIYSTYEVTHCRRFSRTFVLVSKKYQICPHSQCYQLSVVILSEVRFHIGLYFEHFELHHVDNVP